MKDIEIGRDPTEVGLDPARLERLRSHLDCYVADRRLSGWLCTVARGGDVVWVGRGGYRDREHQRPVTDDTIWRLYSMTKPITVVAAMMLYEEGCFDLNDPAGRWIEELRDARVYVSGPASAPLTVPAIEPVRVHHLLTHTSGLTYGFQNLTPVDELYRSMGYDLAYPEDVTLSDAVHDWCTAPLLFEPGSAWNYSVATDVIGRLVEIWSGQSLDHFVRTRVLDPLGMDDTDWYCPADKLDRLAMLYAYDAGEAARFEHFADAATRWPSLLAGGGGLMSTAHDYQRFMTMMLNGGELDGTRLLSSRTVALMTRNHLPNEADLRSFARDSFSEVGQSGVGFGLGVSVVAHQPTNRSLTSEGSFAWGGAASTYFWVDPAEELSVGFYTQLLPSWIYPVRREIQQLVYASLVD
jgi:CubicO group peptidase (beta-lactamase class C family)